MTKDKPFLWPSFSGGRIAPKDMDNGHLFNALRILWNHRAPNDLMIPGSGVRIEILAWPEDYVSKMLEALLGEALTREFDEWQTQMVNFILFNKDKFPK